MPLFDTLHSSKGARVTDDQFWILIEQSNGSQPARPGLLQKLLGRSQSAQTGESFLPKLRGLLTPLPPNEIKDFKVILDRQIDRAYTWDLWAAAYIMMGGCSDDGFEYWRLWLVSQGREVFDGAVANPESLAALNLGSPDDMELEALAYVAPEIFEQKTGNDLYEELPARSGPSDPVGERWEEDSEALAARFPLLSQKYG